MSNIKEIDMKKRFLLDTISGSLAAITISPIVNIIDASVTSSQSGKQKIIPCLKNYTSFMIKNPYKYITQPIFFWSFSVYALTYSINNCVESYCDIKKINNFLPKFIIVSSFNLTISLFKDAAFAKFFGVKLPTNVPLRSYLCWVMRDVIAMTNAFIIPERIVKLIQNNYGKNNKEINFNVESRVQMCVPLLNIIMTTPVNLLGLDIYNNHSSKVKDRIIRVGKNYPKVIPLTFCRMSSAYGIGGMNNINLRRYIIDKYE